MAYNISYGPKVNGAEVVSLALAKQNSKIESGDEDSLLQVFLDASIMEAERYIDSPLLEKQALISYSGWQDMIIIPIGPIQEFTDVKYYDELGSEQTLPSSSYRFDKNTGQLLFKLDEYPELEPNNAFPITLECTAGYKNAEMPDVAKSAVLLMFSFKEMYREDIPNSYMRTFYNALKTLKVWG
ncbi:head-tail connector protein [Flagellimonas sp. S174]|uniref:head-tail connector protein n=1 Tax=Flagellimonas sp. S174 TaxID=3410790 RepID=UPI003BF52497